MRSLVAIHALHRGTFPLHQVDPEEGLEPHGIIHVRVMRGQVHPANDEQTIHLQRDRAQSPRDQLCMIPQESAAKSCPHGPGQELHNSFLHSQTFPAINPDHMHSQHSLGEEGFFTRLPAPLEKAQAFIAANDLPGVQDPEGKTTQQVRL